jgi:hypothetical protein
VEAVFQMQARNDEVAIIPPGGTGFPQFLTPTLPGDYNDDGTVNAADYTVWRNTVHSTTNWAADGNGDRAVDRDDYIIWKNNYGSSGAATIASPAIPEPVSLVLFVGGLAAIATRRRPR